MVNTAICSAIHLQISAQPKHVAIWAKPSGFAPIANGGYFCPVLTFGCSIACVLN